MPSGGFGDEIYEKENFQKKALRVYRDLEDSSWQIVNANQPAEDLQKQIGELALKCIERSRNAPLKHLWVNENCSVWLQPKECCDLETKFWGLNGVAQLCKNKKCIGSCLLLCDYCSFTTHLYMIIYYIRGLYTIALINSEPQKTQAIQFTKVQNCKHWFLSLGNGQNWKKP